MLAPALPETAAQTLYTSAEYAAFIDRAEAAGDDATYELVLGEIVQKPMPTQLHAKIAATIIALLWLYLRSKPLGEVFAEANYQYPSDPMNVRIPDVSFVRADRNLPVVAVGNAPYLPDLAIEIKSVGNTPRELREKALYFLRGGTKLVWLVNPARREVEVCTLGEGGVLTIAVVSGESAVLSGGELLPEFTVPLREIFPPLPTSLSTEGAEQP